MATLWKAIAQANEPVRMSTCMIVASQFVPKSRMATKNGPLGVLRVLDQR